MRPFAASILALGLACSGGGGTACGGSSQAPSIAQNVKIVFRGATSRRADLPVSADACVSGVGVTHTQPSWRAFAAISLTAIPPDR
jgi:hypothetical protein